MENFSGNLSRIGQSDKTEASLYGQGKVSPECLALNIVRIKDSFPKLGNGWYRQLEHFLDSENFTDQRLNDAVENLIKTSVYPEPTIANILGYDKKIKIFTWDELGKISCDYSPNARQAFWNQYSIIKIEDQTRYVLKEYVKYFSNNGKNEA